MAMELIKNIYFSLPKIIRLLLTVLMIMFFFGTLIHFIEPLRFPTVFEGIWWAFVTGATIGYGDYVPHSIQGKITAILLILTGGGLLAYYITTLSSITMERSRNLSKGRVAFKGIDHFILIGWNERTSQLIDLLTSKETNIKIVLIDHTLQHFPPHKHPIHFIHGDPADDLILEKANVQEAKRVVITADTGKKERLADNLTILTTLAIRGNNKNVPIIAEILASKQIENAHRAGASTIIRTNDYMSALFYHELLHIKTATIFEDILQLIQSQQFLHTIISSEFEGKSFHYVANKLSKKHRLLIGVIRNEKWELNPAADFPLIKDDILLTLEPLHQYPPSNK